MASTLDYPTPFDILENHENEDFSSYCNVSIQPSVQFEHCINKPSTKNKKKKNKPEVEIKPNNKPEMKVQGIPKVTDPKVIGTSKKNKPKMNKTQAKPEPLMDMPFLDSSCNKKPSKSSTGKDKLLPISLEEVKKGFIKFVSPVSSGANTPKRVIPEKKLANDVTRNLSLPVAQINGVDIEFPTDHDYLLKILGEASKNNACERNPKFKPLKFAMLEEQLDSKIYLPKKVQSITESNPDKVTSNVKADSIKRGPKRKEKKAIKLSANSFSSMTEPETKASTDAGNSDECTIQKLEQKIQDWEVLLESTSDIKNGAYGASNTQATSLHSLESETASHGATKVEMKSSKPATTKNSRSSKEVPQVENGTTEPHLANSYEPTPAGKLDKKGKGKSFVIDSKGTVTSVTDIETELNDQVDTQAKLQPKKKEKRKTKANLNSNEKEVVKGSKADSKRNQGKGKDNRGKDTKPRINFRTYVSEAKLKEGIDSGRYVVGRVYVARQNCNMAFIQVEGVDDDVYCDGNLGKNRAFHNDTVAFEYLDEKLQAKLYEKKHALPTLVKERNLKVVRVVAIVEPNCPEGEPLLGTLNISEKTKQMVPQDVLFKPINLRFPKVLIKRETLPQDFFTNTKEYVNCLCQIVVTNWPEADEYPSGKFRERLGPLGKLSTDITAVLASNQIFDADFPEDSLACLPSVPYSISTDELKGRSDLRESCIFTIDPPTAKDLDDALSIEAVEGGFRVGVHIADVSHYIHEGTALDKEAHQRSTTVYLMDRNIPMLPRLLCDELCSLVPHKDRLAFTCQFHLDSEANVVKVEYFKSVIRSCAQLSYGQAQSVIDGYGLHAQVSPPHSPLDVQPKILALHHLAQTLRKRRFANGAVDIQSKDLDFELDEDGMPVDVHEHKTGSANHMIEEFMLLANAAVAKTLHAHLPEYALLRCHPGPNPDKWSVLKEVVRQLGYELGFDRDWQHQLGKLENLVHREALMHLTVCCMRPAQYFRSNSDLDGVAGARSAHHFGLNLDYYTHFTSPIRRYPDLVVHRQLMVVLQLTDLPDGDLAQQLDYTTKRCNEAKMRTRRIKDDLTEVYLAHLLRLRAPTQLTPPQSYPAIVIHVHPETGNLTLLILELGLEIKVSAKELQPKRVQSADRKGLTKEKKKVSTKVNPKVHAKVSPKVSPKVNPTSGSVVANGAEANWQVIPPIQVNHLLAEVLANDPHEVDLVAKAGWEVEGATKGIDQVPMVKLHLFAKVQVHLKVESTYPTSIKATLA